MVTTVAFYSYALFLVIIGGLAGLFVPKWGPLKFEVYARAVFKSDLSDEEMASTLNQYRFMKSTEFGFGVFALLFRTEVFTSRRYNRFFLGIYLPRRSDTSPVDGGRRQTASGLPVLHRPRDHDRTGDPFLLAPHPERGVISSPHHTTSMACLSGCPRTTTTSSRLSLPPVVVR